VNNRNLIQDLIEGAGDLIGRKDTVNPHDYIAGLENFVSNIQKQISTEGGIYKLTFQDEIRTYTFFEDFAKNITDIFWVEENGQILYINKAFEDIFEIKREKIYQNILRFFDRVHPDDIDALKFDFPSTQNLEYNYRIIRSDRSIRYIQVRSFPVLNENKTVYQRIGIAKDITEAKLIEAKIIKANEIAEKKNKELAFLNQLLESSEKKYRQLFMDMGSAFALHEMVYNSSGKPIDYIYIEINNAFEEITGLKRENVIGKGIMELMPDTEPFWLNTYAKVARTGKSVSFENYFFPLKKHFSVTAYSPGKHMFAVIFNDISERKEREQLIKENEIKFRTIIENMPVAVAVIDYSGNFVQINQYFIHLFGYTLEEVINLENWMLLSYPDLSYRKFAFDSWLTDIQHAIDEPAGAISRVFKIQSKSQKKLDVNLSFKLIDNKILTIFTDLTERIEFEEELRELNEEYQTINEELIDSNQRIFRANKEISEAEEKYRAILETMADGVMVIDSEGKLISCNKASEQILNFDKEFFLGKAEFLNNWQTIYENGEPFPPELHPLMITLKTGIPQNNIVMGIIDHLQKIKYISINTRQLLNNNDLPSVIISFTDITQKKETEKALKSNQKLITSLQEVVSGTIGKKFFETIVVRLAESLNADIAMVGEICRDDTSMIKTISACVDGQIIENFKYAISDSPCEIIIKQGACSFTNNLGSLFPKSSFIIDNNINAYVGVPLFDSRAKIIGIMLALFRNPIPNSKLSETLLHLFAGRAGTEIERLEAEKELEIAKNKAEESDRLKSAFLANMSHEIRTPMNGILGFVNLIENENLAPDKRKKYIGIINSSAQQLLTIITDVLDISKIESGLVEIRNTKVNINTILNALLSQFRLEIKIRNKKGIRLKLNKPGLPRKLEIVSDEVRLRQILSNLLGNAVKFTNSGTIEYGYQFLDNKTILFYVSDTGIGIDKEYQEMIFERFRQVENVKLVAGTGLGLSISKGLVELLGGKIWLESEVDKGSVFYFTLPVKH